ncbi:MAG: hypothetical protein O2960_14020 [Verrucomicrobia bacterium]|nr:hypothetical protein [Verrucomicrobiota bacterium]
MKAFIIACASILSISMLGCRAEVSESFLEGMELSSLSGKKLDEISGMVVSRRDPGMLWVHNDGSKGRLFAVNTNGQVLATFSLRADVDDLEDIAVGPRPENGPAFLYLGDIGDNQEKRKFIRVFRFLEPEWVPGKDRDGAVSIDEFETLILTYPDQPHDAEALLVDPISGDLLIVTKEHRRARVYRAQSDRWREPGTVRLEFVAQIAFDDVSGGDMSSDGALILLRREEKARLWRRHSGETISAALRGPGEAVPVIGPPREANGESIAFDPNGSGYYTLGEGEKEKLFFFPRK